MIEGSQCFQGSAARSPFAQPQGLQNAGAAPDHRPQASSRWSWAPEANTGTVHTAEEISDGQARIHSCMVPCDPVSGVHAKCQVLNMG